MTIKIGFCFLIYNVINHEDVWQQFLSNIDHDLYNIYIHHKCYQQSVYFDKYKLPNCIKTKYCHVSIVHAHNLLFKRAYEDGCHKIISLSQACVPFKSFNHIYRTLAHDDLCYFNAAPQSQCFPRCDLLEKYYNRDVIQKSSNWFILNRETCKLVTNYNHNKINNEYSQIYCPEEHFFITMAFQNKNTINWENIVLTPNLANDATTFTNWVGMDYKYPSDNGLKNYTTISDEEVLYLLQSKCLFGRKFNCPSLSANSTYLACITSSD